MPNLNAESVIHERLKRQGLLNPLEHTGQEEEYIRLFKRLQPVAPIHFTRPGSPPSLVHRTVFNDSQVANALRKKHRIIKGRFLGGRVGYVLQEDLELYATVFKRPLPHMKPIYEEMMAVIKNAGGISKDQLKEELDFPAGEITKALQSLQQAFLVYEDQIDIDWDTGWFDFTNEWFEVNPGHFQYEQAVSKVLMNFLDSFVFATVDEMKSWSQLKLSVIQKVMKDLAEQKKVAKIEIRGLGTGYIQERDLKVIGGQEVPRSVFMLDRSDFLARAYMRDLQARYKGLEVLQYLLIDGEFQGAVLGHWRIGPYDVDDVRLDFDNEEVDTRKDEIIEAIRKGYPAETARILHYNGETL